MILIPLQPNVNNLSIATSTNTKFFRDLLGTFGIITHKGDGAVAINARDSIKKASEISMFRYSTEIRDNLDKLSRMIDTWDHSRKMTTLEIDHIRKMRSKGISWGEIAESLFDTYNHPWPYYTVMRWSRKSGAG